ncbi:MAG: hypothetical protein KKB25_00850 [Nanoarchaeota archaeon]|nr:hypothetical protein [Nanoarchaeota archaeon]
MKYLSDLPKLLKSEMSEILNMFGYYRRGLFTKDEAKTIEKATKTAKAFIDYNKKYGTVGRGFNDFE